MGGVGVRRERYNLVEGFSVWIEVIEFCRKEWGLVEGMGYSGRNGV